MQKSVWRVLALSLLLSLSGPALAQEADHVVNADEIVKAANWDTVETVTVEIEEHSYTPNKLTLKANQAYKLVLKNVGEEKHYFTAPEMYKAVALRKVQSDKDGEIKAPYLKAVEIYSGGQLTLFLVPVKAGTYPVYCTIEDHRTKGMDGSITIE